MLAKSLASWEFHGGWPWLGAKPKTNSGKVKGLCHQLLVDRGQAMGWCGWW